MGLEWVEQRHQRKQTSKTEVNVMKSRNIRQDEYDLETGRREESRGDNSLKKREKKKRNCYFLKQKVKGRRKWKDAVSKYKRELFFMPHLCSSHCFSLLHFSKIGRTSYIPHLCVPSPTLCSETKDFKRLPLHRWVLDHYHLYYKHT